MPENVVIHVHPYAKQLANHLLYEAFHDADIKWIFTHTKVVVHPEWSDEDQWELEGPDNVVWSPGA